MRVRLADFQDVEVVRELEMEAFGFTWEADAFERQFARADCLYTVGELDESPTPLAMASLSLILDEANLLSIAVKPEFRGSGLGRHLLGQNLALCQALGVLWMALEVKWDNLPALALYRHFGFTTVGQRKKYYRDGQDARVMLSGCLSEPKYRCQLAEYEQAAGQLAEQWKVSRVLP